MLKTLQLVLAISLLLLLGAAGCSRPWTPPRDQDLSIPPPPQFMVRTPHGLVPESEATNQSADQRSKKGRSTDKDQPELSSRADFYSGTESDWKRSGGRSSAARGQATGLLPDSGPIYSQSYYVRPEHTSTGYIEGRYGRTDNYTPGEHTSTGYIPGNYRGDGNYTRPEHTSTGYIPGHYRADPQPDARTMMGASPTPAVSTFRPYGR